MERNLAEEYFQNEEKIKNMIFSNTVHLFTGNNQKNNKNFS